MAARKVEVEVVVIEVDLDAALIPKHLADSARLRIGVHLPVNQFNVLPLRVRNDEHFPHVRVVQFLKIVLFHKCIKSLDELLPLF